MSKPDPPQPPNPIATAGAATSTNVATAIANANLNNVNQVTPQGNLTYSNPSNYNFTDPVSGQSYSIPQFTVTQTLSPTEQATTDQSNQAKLNLASIGNMSSAQLQQILGSPINLNNIPGMGNTSGLAGLPPPASSVQSPGPNQQLTFGNTAGGIQYSVGGTAGGVQYGYGDNAGVLADRANVEQSLFQRMQPQLDLQQSQMRQQLADQGIKYGSPAYTAAMDNYNRQVNDLRLGVTQQGGQEQQLQENIQAAHAGFANAAQQQDFTEQQQRGTFTNAAQQQDFTQQQQRGTFANAAATNDFQQAAMQSQLYNSALAQQQAQQEQLFNAQQAARSQALSEQYAYRDQPLNEISALLSGSQVQNPNFINATGNKIPTTDVAGLVNTNFSQSLSNYQQQNANYNNIVGGLFGAAAGIGVSDVRAKTNVHKVGSVFASTPQKVAKLPIYQYSYKDDPASTAHIGPMAQDVEKIDPAAVLQDRTGLKYVDHSRVMGGILKAA